MIKHYHLNKYFNLIQENSLLKSNPNVTRCRTVVPAGITPIITSNIHAGDGVLEGKFTSVGLPNGRQALTLSRGIG